MIVAWQLNVQHDTIPSHPTRNRRLNEAIGCWQRPPSLSGACFLCAPVLIRVIAICHMPVWVYLVCVIEPGASLAMVRSFAEHRAVPEAERRMAIVESAWILGPRFPFNNLHPVHHLRTSCRWPEQARPCRLPRALPFSSEPQVSAMPPRSPACAPLSRP